MRKLLLAFMFVPALALAQLAALIGTLGSGVESEPPSESFAAPSWVLEIPVGTWAVISQNGETMADHDPCPEQNCTYSGNNGLACIVDNCWNGAIIATGFGDKGSWVTWGGGHNGYWGSEVYAFDLATLEWDRLTDPATDGAPGCDPPEEWAEDGLFADGRPIAPHTYTTLQYYEPANAMLTLRVEVSSCGGIEATLPSFFSFDTLQWTTAASFGPTNTAGGWTVIDSSRNLVITEGGDTGAQFIEYTPDETLVNGSYTARSPKLTALDGVAAIDPVNDVLVVINAPWTCPSNDPRLLDLDSRAGAMVTTSSFTESGTRPNLCRGSLEYVPSLGAFVARPQGEVPDVLEFRLTSGDPLTGTWTWSSLVDESNELTPQISDIEDTGRYNKFRCIEYDDAAVCIEVNSVEGPVYAFRVN